MNIRYFTTQLDGFWNQNSNRYPAFDKPQIVPAETLRGQAPLYMKRIIDQDPTSFYLIMQCDPLKGDCSRDMALELTFSFFHDFMKMPSSYEQEGYSPEEAVSKELLPAENDREYRNYYEEQMGLMAQQMEQDRRKADDDEFQRKHGFDRNDPDIIDVDVDMERGVAEPRLGRGANSRAVGSAQTTAVGMPKKIFYAVDFHIPYGGELGYDRGGMGRVGGRGGMGRLGRGPNGYLREKDEDGIPLRESLAGIVQQSGGLQKFIRSIMDPDLPQQEVQTLRRFAQANGGGSPITAGLAKYAIIGMLAAKYLEDGSEQAQEIYGLNGRCTSDAKARKETLACQALDEIAAEFGAQPVDGGSDAKLEAVVQAIVSGKADSTHSDIQDMFDAYSGRGMRMTGKDLDYDAADLATARLTSAPRSAGQYAPARDDVENVYEDEEDVSEASLSRREQAGIKAMFDNYARGNGRSYADDAEQAERDLDSMEKSAPRVNDRYGRYAPTSDELDDLDEYDERDFEDVQLDESFDAATIRRWNYLGKEL